MSKHLGFAVAALLVAGCGRPATQAPAKPIRAAAAPPPAAPLAPSNDVELLDPGRAPREPLRYRFEAETHEPYLTISDDDVTDGPIRAYHAAEVQVEAVLPDGSARLVVALRRDTAPGEEPDRRRLHVDARGQLVEDGVADNSIAADTLLAALPVEPVGAGARWRTRRPSAADSTITYELLALEPGGAHLRETATIFEQGVAVGNEATWESETTTELTGDLHVAWKRVVARADWQARQSGRTVERDLFSRIDRPDDADVGSMTFRTSIVPAGAFSRTWTLNEPGRPVQ